MKSKKIISTAVAAAMTIASMAAFSTVSFAAVTTTTVIDDNFNSVSLSDKSGMNSAWQNLNSWWNTAPAQRAEGDICWKWEANGNNAGAWEQIYLNMDALKADDTLNISYDLNLGDEWNTKSTIALEGGTNNSEVIYLGENYNELGNFHVGTEYDVATATSIEGNIERNKWVTVNITVKNSLTSISVDGKSVCTNVAPPSGYTFNQAGVNKIRFMADGIYNDNGKNVYIDNVKVTVDREVAPTKPGLLNEDFDSYEIGQTARNTIMASDSNWYPWVSEDTSTIVEGETGHGKALAMVNPNGSFTGSISFEYQNLNISKQYAVVDMMFKCKAGCNFTIQLLNGETYKELNINDLTITGDGTQLSEEWYRLYEVVDRTAEKVYWTVKDMNDTAIAAGTINNIGEVKNFNSFKFASFVDAVKSPVYVDEISITETDEQPVLPKLPPKTTIFEENFNDYDEGSLFRDVKKDAWRMFYSDASEIVADGVGNAMKMLPVGNMDNINWTYENIAPELNIIDFTIMFKAANEKTNFDIKMLYSVEGQESNGNQNIVNINQLKITDDESKTISANTWYKLNATIDRIAEKVDYTITEYNSGDEICKISKNFVGAATFCGFGMYSYGIGGVYNDLYFDEIKVDQKCGTPALTADGLAFYAGSTPQTNTSAISTATDKIVLTFNTVMNAKSLKDNVTITGGGETVAYTGELADNVYTMTLGSALKPTTAYTINIGADVKAYTGEPIAQAGTETFTTAAGEMHGEFVSVKCDGQPLTAVSQLTEGKTLAISVNYKNTTGNALAGYIITAYFNGNVFVNSQYTPVSRAADVTSDTITINPAVPAISGATQMKVFFWDGFDTMLPISEAFEIK